MRTRPHPRLEGHAVAATGPSPAEPALASDGSGAPKVVARQGVLSALRSDTHPADGRHIVAMLRITAPRGAVPTATSVCDCGRNRSAVGRQRVLALIEEHTAHRTTCLLRNETEGSTAA
ncbi:hypothetical protein ACFPM3_11270 [Streptomyces coeruleoprunus]|uniref:Uncharacterized protein n=1 Tax=Streptomyces coeruleoprunus TaxID=285563 RepID=A0ABV9XB87_9ACTN